MRQSLVAVTLLVAFLIVEGFSQEPHSKGEPMGGDKAKSPARRIPLDTLNLAPDKKGDPLKPATIASADELAKSPVVMNAADKLKKQIDFSKEKLVVFAWEGRPKEVVGPTAQTTEDKKTTVVFTFTPAGATKGAVDHLFLYVVPKDAEVEVRANPRVPK